MTTVAGTGTGVVTTVAVGGYLDEAAAPIPPAMQQQLIIQITMGTTTKSTNAATDTPTAIPTMLVAISTEGQRVKDTSFRQKLVLQYPSERWI